MPTTSFLFSVILSLATPPSPAPDERPLVEKYLQAGQYAEGEMQLRHCRTVPRSEPLCESRRPTGRPCFAASRSSSISEYCAALSRV